MLRSCVAVLLAALLALGLQPAFAELNDPMPSTSACAAYNGQLVYQVWDGTGSSDPCTTWDGATLMDPTWVNDHARFGLGTNTTTGETIAWACGVIIGADQAADAPIGANIHVRDAVGSESLVKQYAAKPCCALQETFDHSAPGIYYRQAW